MAYYGEPGPGPKGTVSTVLFELDGQEFAALNGGPAFKLGAGTVRFVGPGSNSFTSLHVQQGTLETSKSSGTVLSTGTLTIGDGASEVL